MLKCKPSGGPSEELYFWIGLNMLPNVGPVRFRAIVEHFGSAKGVWEASLDELVQVEGIGKGLAETIVRSRYEVDIEGQIARAGTMGVDIITIGDPQYPEKLRMIYDPPPVLYVKGVFSPVDNKSIAVVGTRKASPYGRAVAEEVAKGLAKHGITVVSGMARGIDSRAHMGALAGGGRTIAVLGSGLDVPYPPENAKLMEEIASSGAVISEFPLGTPPLPQNFVARNRVISGLALGVVVVEGDVTSGAMLTADFALEQGREVFAVPGSIASAGSRGPHSLIKQGARLVEGVDDILEELGLKGDGCPRGGAREGSSLSLGLDEVEKHLYNVLGLEPQGIDILIEKTGLAPEKVSAALVKMELAGLVEGLPGNFFVRRP